MVHLISAKELYSCLLEQVRFFLNPSPLNAGCSLRIELAGGYYRKIHYLTREFRVKLHVKTDIA